MLEAILFQLLRFKPEEPNSQNLRQRHPTQANSALAPNCQEASVEPANVSYEPDNWHAQTYKLLHVSTPDGLKAHDGRFPGQLRDLMLAKFPERAVCATQALYQVRNWDWDHQAAECLSMFEASGTLFAASWIKQLVHNVIEYG